VAAEGKETKLMQLSMLNSWHKWGLVGWIVEVPLLLAARPYCISTP
jgi:hypothetical protein